MSKVYSGNYKTNTETQIYLNNKVKLTKIYVQNVQKLLNQDLMSELLLYVFKYSKTCKVLLDFNI